MKTYRTMLCSFLTAIGLAALVSGCAGGTKSVTPNDSEAVFGDITPEDAAALIEKHRGDDRFAIIDVRTAEEFEEGHIAGAKNIDYYKNIFRESITKLNPTYTYLVYCRSGNRSSSALKIMKELGFLNVWNLKGGIKGWQEKSLPVETKK